MKLELEVPEEVGKLILHWAEFLKQTPEQYAAKFLEVYVPTRPNPPAPGALMADLRAGKYPDPDDDDGGNGGAQDIKPLRLPSSVPHGEPVREPGR